MKVQSNKQYNPQMHSAEHILNQTMVRMFDCGRSFSNHIEKKKSKCDYHFSRNLTEDEISELSERVNETIKRNLPVVEEFITRDVANDKFNLERLPNSAGEMIRIIKIGDYDACPCSGLHVSNTKEIGSFNIISTDFNNGVLRIRFKLQETE
jgi:misacylated tRNA(Ala) deacylase